MQPPSSVPRYTRLCINTTKTKVLRTNAKVTDPIYIDGLEVEDVNSFIYLGALFTEDQHSIFFFSMCQFAQCCFVNQGYSIKITNRSFIFLTRANRTSIVYIRDLFSYNILPSLCTVCITFASWAILGATDSTLRVILPFTA